jgi:hypothetical protein
MNRRDFLSQIGLTAGGLLLLQSGCAVKSIAKPSIGGAPAVSAANPTAEEFASPPFACGPWVYWFWLDVNVTREGITADLEAMKAVGIAGVLIADVNQGTPASFNGAQFGDSKWYELFQFACEEANRLGMEMNMINGPGWCGSGGPWITPELSMQVVVWSRTRVAGGQPANIKLPEPEARMNFYRDIAVLAFPTPAADAAGGGYRLPDLSGLTESNPSPWHPNLGVQYNLPTRVNWENLPADQLVFQSSILDVTKKMDARGVLHCELPAGEWTVLRLGHTTTGVVNHPAPAGGVGLETDKLSRPATLAQFEALLGRIIQKIGPLAGKTLVATHIDSWETGFQNWTPTMRDDFKRLRGYDLQPYLPVLTGQVVDSLEISQRFLWDFRKTIGELLLENYAMAMREVAQQHGLRLSIEGYAGEPANDVAYGGEAVEPMSECWSWERFEESGTVTEMVSAGHVYGHNIIGQETFTADSNEKWQGHPAVVKDIGDWTFCEGINRFVFHRYAMQPWTNPHSAPGMCMGPWGLHYERTQTWWHMSKPWHDYVARCCYMLRRGHFVADVCYLQAEGLPSQFSLPDLGPRPAPGKSSYPFPPQKGPGHPPRRPGYNYDACPPEVVLERMEFQNGFLTLPGGMKYRILVLPDSPTMTPNLLRKIKKLVSAGALVMGPKPEKSPSLGGYPHCDHEIQKLSAELWDSGKIISGKTAPEVLAARGIKPDFECDQPSVHWVHRQVDELDIYFVANGMVADIYPYAGSPMVANCSFRITGAKPEIWDPETGRISAIALYDLADGMTRIPLVLAAKASVFIIFRQGQPSSPSPTIRSVSHDGNTVLPAPDELGARNENPPVTIEAGADGRVQLLATEPGNYRCLLASGKAVALSIPNIPRPLTIPGPWTVKFPDGWGAPAQIQMDDLIAWNKHSEAGVQYFSGTASYHCDFDVPAELLGEGHRLELDLGNVAVMADVTLNGRRLGVLWKPPFRVEVSSSLHAGQNSLEIAVANLWINRMIGDQQLPPDAERNPRGALTNWPQWLLEGKPSPTGRFTFATWEQWHKNDPLVDSGLIGPVRLLTTVCRPVNFSPEA